MPARTDSIPEVVSLEIEADKALPTRAPKTRKALLPVMALLGAAMIVSMFVTILLQNEATRATDVRGDALRSRETGHVLQTRSMNLFSTLADLPCQSTSFISNLDHVLIVVDGVVRKYTIENFALHNASYLVLYTTLRTGHTPAPQTHSVVIRDRRAYVDYGDGTWGRISVDTKIDVHQKRNLGTARRLADLVKTAPPSRARGVVTWAELMLEYEQQPGHRKLSASGGNALYDLYRWFGGVAVASGADDDGSAVDQASCGGPLVTSVAAPVPDLPLLSKWTTVGAFNGTWYMDLTLDQPRFHLISSANETLQHEVFSGDTKSTYWSWDPEFEPDGRDLDPDLSRALAQTKGGCSNMAVTPANESAAPTTIEVDEIHPDGSATWRVQGWLVRVNSQGGVIAIGDVSVTSVVEYDTSVERAGGRDAGIALYQTCVEGEEDPVPSFEDGAVTLFNSTGSGRKLRDVFGWLSFSNWCGPGTHLLTTVCPGSSEAQSIVGSNYDSTADRACRRHDHAGRENNKRFNCNADRDLTAATSNAAIRAVYGSWGVAQFYGCYDTGSYRCWKKKKKWWGSYWYPSTCYGEWVKYGPSRYDSIRRDYPYKPRAYTCSGDNSPW